MAAVLQAVRRERYGGPLGSEGGDEFGRIQWQLQEADPTAIDGLAEGSREIPSAAAKGQRIPLGERMQGKGKEVSPRPRRRDGLFHH